MWSDFHFVIGLSLGHQALRPVPGLLISVLRLLDQFHQALHQFGFGVEPQRLFRRLAGLFLVT